MPKLQNERKMHDIGEPSSQTKKDPDPKIGSTIWRVRHDRAEEDVTE